MESASANKRIYKIDNIRAIAIILVVFGHSIILYSSSWNLYITQNAVPELDFLKKIINLIQMPLFFALAGFLFVSTLQKKSFSVVVKDKFKRLLIPYFSIAFLWLIPIRLLIKYPNYNISFSEIVFKSILYGSDNGHLWYLIALFWCFIFCYLLNKTIEMIYRKLCHNSNVDKEFNTILNIIFAISGMMFILSKLYNIYYFDSTFNYFIWFMLGCILKRHFESISRIKQINKVFLLIVCLCVNMVSLFVFNNTRISIITDFLSSVLWVLLIFCLIPNRKNSILLFLSSNSFGIYLFHSPLVYITYTYIPNINPFIVVMLNFIIFGTVALLLTMIISKRKFSFIIGEYT